MANYSNKNAIMDLGFIDGCVRVNAPTESVMLDCVLSALDEMEQESVSDKPWSRKFIHNLGFIRGVLWLAPMPGAYSLAMDRLMEFFVEGTVDWYQLPQPFTGREHKDPVLSDELRDEINSDYLLEGRKYAIETARLAGFEEQFIIDRIVPPGCRDGSATPTAAKVDSESEAVVQPTVDVQPEDPVLSPELSVPLSTPPASSTNDDQKNPWTSERRACAAERAKGQKKPPFDSDLESVKADFDAGLSFGAISRKWGCSDQHIRNFLTKHGIDPRRGGPGTRNGGRPPLTEVEKNLIIDEKAKGTPSREIGEMVDRSQHAVDVKYGDLKKAGLVPEEHLTPEFLEEKKRRQNELVSVKMKALSAGERGDGIADIDGESTESLSAVLAVMPPHRLTVAHPGYAGKREDSALRDDDWGDIQNMLAKGNSRESIASDFDVSVEALNEFIEARLRKAKAKAGQSPGKSLAPHPTHGNGA